MAVVADRVRESSTTTGTGTLTLNGAVTGFRTFEATFGTSASVYYVIAGGAEWEVGIGTTGTGTLSRDTVLASSAGGTTKVTFSAGTKDVFCAYPAGRAVTTSDSATLTNKTISGADNTLSNIGNSSLTNSSVTVNGTSISLGGSGTVTAAAGTLTGTTLASNVVSSSLTSVGTIGTGVWQGTAISDTYLATIATAGKVSNSATTATSANTASAIVARDASGNFTAGTITATLSGAAPAGSLSGTTLASNVVSSSLTSVGTLANLTVTNTITGSVSGNAATATKLATARAINGTNFDGSADITVTAAAGTLTGSTLASGVTASSLTSVGTLSSLAVSGVTTLSAGTASAPALTTSGDTNTGTFFPAADTIAWTTGGSERARITSAGTVLIGTTNDAVNGAAGLLVQSSSSANQCRTFGVYNPSATSTTAFANRLIKISALGSGADTTLHFTDEASYNSYIGAGGGSIYFATNGTTERARITSGGYFKASDAGTYALSTGSYHELRSSANDTVALVSSTNASFSSTVVTSQTDRSANSAFNLFRGVSGGVEQFSVSGNGVIYAQNTTVQSISDARLKENVRTASEGLAIITALRPVRFDWKAGHGNDRKDQLGFIAQEIEPVFADAVSEWEMDGETYKTVGPAALIPVLVNAIKELNERIIALEA